MTDAINVKEKCSQCTHHATCKFSGEYEKFNETLKDELHKWGSEFVFIPTLEVSCRYFTKMIPTTRPEFLRQVEGEFVEVKEEKSPCATCSQDPTWCCGCEKEREWRADDKLKKQVDSKIEKGLSKGYTKEDAEMPHITEAERLEPATIEYATRYICKTCNAVWAGSKPKFCPVCGYEIRKIFDMEDNNGHGRIS